MNRVELFGRTHELFLRQRDGRLPSEVKFPLLQSDITIPQGHINTSMVVESMDQSRYILRQQNEDVRPQLISHIHSEYEGARFLDNPKNGFRMRNAEEQ